MMSKKIQRLNIIDIEATCWENGITPDGQKQREASEIIEIGIVQVNLDTLKIESKQSYLVKPTRYPVLSEYCTKLTGITNDMLDKEGTTIDYAIARMVSEFKTMKYEWGSWGDYDRTQFQRECQQKQLQYPFHKTHLNLKYILSMMVGVKVQRNVKGMLDFLHMKFEGSAHRGVDDAYNIANMFIETISSIRRQCMINERELIWGDDFYKENK